MAKLIEHETANTLKTIVQRESDLLLKKVGGLDKVEIAVLLTLCKAHQILNGDTRELMKAGLLGKLTDEELEAISAE